MHLLRKLWILSAVLFVSTVSAQYTGVINSNRPGFSESPYSVGTGVYQLETSIFYRKIDQLPTFSRPQSTGINFLFRTSFFKEQLEINLNFTYQNTEIGFENIFASSYFSSGIQDLSIGAKYLLYEQEYDDKSKEVRSWKKRFAFDWKRLIPSVAAYAGVHAPVGNDLFFLYDEGGFSPKVGVLLQNDLSSDLNIVTNIFYDRITTDAPELSYIITATYSINDRWSTFFENQTLSNKFRVETNLGSGIAYLWNRDLQLNGSLRMVVDGEANGIYTSVGASYRLDKHADEFIEVDEFGNPLEEYVEDSGRGFFGKVWDGIKSLFTFGKKKKKKKAAKEIQLKDKTIESIQKNTNIEEATINNDTIQKAQVKPTIRTRPQRVRVKPTKFKAVKKKKEKGGFLGFFGKKKKKKDDQKEDLDALKKKDMSDKEIKKQLKELEKEQRKLEKEQKKEEAKRKKEEAKKKKREKKKKEKEKEEEENEEENG
jgi:hypothetical protein